MNEPEQVSVSVEPVLLDKRATCAMLGGIGVDKLNELMHQGAIVPKVIGQRVVFHINEVRRFAESCQSWEPKR